MESKNGSKTQSTKSDGASSEDEVQSPPGTSGPGVETEATNSNITKSDSLNIEADSPPENSANSDSSGEGEVNIQSSSVQQQVHYHFHGPVYQGGLFMNTEVKDSKIGKIGASSTDPTPQIPDQLPRVLGTDGGPALEGLETEGAVGRSPNISNKRQRERANRGDRELVALPWQEEARESETVQRTPGTSRVELSPMEEISTGEELEMTSEVQTGTREEMFPKTIVDKTCLDGTGYGDDHFKEGKQKLRRGYTSDNLTAEDSVTFTNQLFYNKMACLVSFFCTDDEKLRERHERDLETKYGNNSKQSLPERIVAGKQEMIKITLQGEHKDYRIDKDDHTIRAMDICRQTYLQEYFRISPLPAALKDGYLELIYTIQVGNNIVKRIPLRLEWPAPVSTVKDQKEAENHSKPILKPSGVQVHINQGDKVNANTLVKGGQCTVDGDDCTYTAKG